MSLDLDISKSVEESIVQYLAQKHAELPPGIYLPARSTVEKYNMNSKHVQTRMYILRIRLPFRRYRKA